LQQKCGNSVRPMKRTSSPEGFITVPSGSRAGVAVVNSLLLDLQNYSNQR